MNRAEKEVEIEFISGQFKKSQIALCAEYRGLTVLEIGELRRDLKKVGAVSRVVKNTLGKISAKKVYANEDPAELQKLVDLLEGPNFVVFSADPVAPAKIMSKYSETHEKLVMKGGWFEGECIDPKKVKMLSTMPSKEELLTKLLRLMMAPATQLVQVMNAPAGQLVRLLGAFQKKLEDKK